jgi:hypothetical protein
VIEFLEGEMVVYTGEDLPVAASANSTYQDSVAGWRNHVALNTSLERFIIAADRVDSYTPGEDQEAVDYAFETLAQVANPGWTQCSLVFDPHARRVYFHTQLNPNIRYLDFDQLDFTCGDPVRTLDVQADLAGNISDLFDIYDHDTHLAYIIRTLGELVVPIEDDQIEAALALAESYPCLTAVQDKETPERLDTPEPVSAEETATPEPVLLETIPPETLEHPDMTPDIPWFLIVMVIVGVVVLVIVGLVVVIRGRITQ